MIEMDQRALVERLRRLDEDAALMFDDGRRFRLIIVGGSALVMRNYIIRATHDIDAVSVPRELGDLLCKYDINSRAEAYISNFPYHFEDRVQYLLTGRKIDFLTASLEDIVIAKLHSNRTVDEKDVESPAVIKKLNWGLLDHLANDADEAKASALNERSHKEFLFCYENYVRRWRP